MITSNDGNQKKAHEKVIIQTYAPRSPAKNKFTGPDGESVGYYLDHLCLDYQT
jgi:hypothetical protein